MKQQALHIARFEEIEAYLLGRSSEPAQFEERMASDLDLREEVEVQRENMLAVELGGFSRTIAEISKRNASADPVVGPAPVVRRASTLWVLRIAAGVALLLGVAWWFLARPDAFDQVLAEYYVADPGLPVPMSATNDAAFHDAMVDYKMGAYPKAIAKWNVLLVNDPQNDTLRYYLANAQMADVNVVEAIQLYQGLSADTKSVFHDKAEWRLFLAYVHMHDAEQVQNFKVASGSPYAAEVSAIQELLKE